MQNARLDEAQAGIKFARRNINNPYGRKRRRTKKPLDESESGECKSWLKAQHSENEDHGNYQSIHKVMLSSGRCFATLGKESVAEK